MNKYKIIVFLLIVVDVVLFVWLLIRGKTVAILDPKGIIALQERNLIITAVGLMFLVVIPVFIMTFYIAWKYRANNAKAEYAADWSGNKKGKFILWAFPSVIICILAIITWKSTHALDPYRPIDSTKKPLIIQVVALNWKWLFIYPEQNIATVNFIEFPVQTPVTFELTADAPMNSLWIPQLGGQMYAMAGMQTQLHLRADTPGDYAGSEVEINGSGFAGMRFTARASSQSDFDTWVRQIKLSSRSLNFTTYNKLAIPSENNPVTSYASVDKDLYNGIMMKFMMPSIYNRNVNQ